MIQGTACAKRHLTRELMPPEDAAPDVDGVHAEQDHLVGLIPIGQRVKDRRHGARQEAVVVADEEDIPTRRSCDALVEVGGNADVLRVADVEGTAFPRLKGLAACAFGDVRRVVRNDDFDLALAARHGLNDRGDGPLNEDRTVEGRDADAERGLRRTRDRPRRFPAPKRVAGTRSGGPSRARLETSPITHSAFRSDPPPHGTARSREGISMA